ncbi:5'-nucleotidase C-terminal domain-containing protein [Saccharibacillus alkalitolerans]|uniref:Bifunctional metallophosphatase/5'-nucleotidase n=1 Tax=Saccharibacillus alkalitolerans TaxID=2705290 RepID=A0ABX0F3B9_9BACL|nr:5'-nucleotidase C-terminal domain-containing protein [Saccharibacillus alkalitolerans]NGZ75107.1 bifunctional metallophosphatase/5'-nucleotidase [Saccharibacillus alkalitolerans]
MKRSKAKKNVRAALTAAVLVSALTPALGGQSAQAAETTASNGFDLRILHTNDTHAHLDNIDRRVTAINTERNDRTLLLDAGDVFSGTLYFNQYGGLADLYFMNQLKYDAMVFGNHEFDKGPAGLAPFVKEAKFPFVSSNIDFSADKDLGPLSVKTIGDPAAAGKIYPSVIKEVNGEKVGIIGLTTSDTVALASPGETVKFKDDIESAQKAVDELTAKGINKIVALSHLGYAEDQELAKEVDGIDIIVGGHSHTQLDEPTVYEGGKAPVVIVQTGEYDKNLGRLDATFDDKGVLTKWEGKLINLDAQNEDKSYVIKGDEASAAKLKEYAAKLEELKTTVIGKSDVTLDGERGTVRKQETNLGDFMADGMRAKVESIVELGDAKAYVTIQNGGGIRASIPAGDITLGSLLTTMPYGNNLSALKMTGAEIKAALENGVSGVETGEGRFPQVSGMKFTYDSKQPGEKIDSVTGQVTQEGSRITDIQILGEDGKYTPIDPKAYYIVATNSYIAAGGDFYSSMAAAKEDGRYYELNLVDYEVFREYLDSVGDVKQKTEGRITDAAGSAVEAPAGGKPAASTFSDIAGYAKADAVEAAYSAGIVSGYADGTFRPAAAVTRAEFVTMLGRAIGAEGDASKHTYIDNVPAWAAPYVSGLEERGLLGSFQDEVFGPKLQVTSGEAAELIALAANVDPSTIELSGSADTKITRGNLVDMLAKYLIKG